MRNTSGLLSWFGRSFNRDAREQYGHGIRIQRRALDRFKTTTSESLQEPGPPASDAEALISAGSRQDAGPPGSNRDPLHSADGHTIIGLDRSWVSGEVVLEPPCHLFAGFGVSRTLRVGAFTYSWSHITPEVSKIGRYCSISPGVQFGHAEHPTSWLSTSSFTYDETFMGPPGERAIAGSRYVPVPLPLELSSRRIIVGNDVWIGLNSYIRSGITLGDGCIVGACAVVSADVPPYAIVVGNPARVVKYRFSEEIVARLIALSWWRYAFTDFHDVDPSNIDRCIPRLEELAAGGLKPFQPDLAVVTGDGQTKSTRFEARPG